MSFVLFKYVGIVHIPGPLLGYKPQFVAILNGARSWLQPELA